MFLFIIIFFSFFFFFFFSYLFVVALDVFTRWCVACAPFPPPLIFPVPTTPLLLWKVVWMELIPPPAPPPPPPCPLPIPVLEELGKGEVVVGLRRSGGVIVMPPTSSAEGK